MDRIADPSAVDIGGGRQGFADRNLGLGVEGTVVRAAFLNGLQEEHVGGIIEHLGLVPASGDLTQVRQALSRWFGGGIKSIVANTTLVADDAGFIQASAAAGNRTITLPEADSANGRPIRLFISRTDTSANTLSVLPQGADTLNGLTGAPLPVPIGATLTLISDGVSAWFLIASTGLYLAQEIAATGNFVVPWWSRSGRVVATGGGGSAGYNSSYAGGGGGGGGTAIKRIQGWTPGATIACTMGAGGVAPVTAVDGNPGGTTAFGAYCSATGGAAGQGGNTTSNAGGVGGIGAAGDINIRGGYGTDGKQITGGGGGNGGDGGGTYWSGCTRGATGFATGLTPATNAWGVGGSGGGCNATLTAGGSGGAGRQGVIFAECYA